MPWMKNLFSVFTTGCFDVMKYSCYYLFKENSRGFYVFLCVKCLFVVLVSNNTVLIMYSFSYSCRFLYGLIMLDVLQLQDLLWSKFDLGTGWGRAQETNVQVCCRNFVLWLFSVLSVLTTFITSCGYSLLSSMLILCHCCIWSQIAD